MEPTVGLEEDDEKNDDFPSRLEKQLQKLSNRWSGTEYALIISTARKVQEWEGESVEVRNILMEWLKNNKESRLVEEAEDILDRFEQLAEAGEMGMTKELLLEATDIVTAVVVAWNIDVERISFTKTGEDDETFQMDGKVKRVGRA